MQNTAQSIQSINSINSPEAQILQFPNTPKSKHSHPKAPQQRVSPIRNPEKVSQIYNALLNSGRYGLRNATIFALQLAIGRRTNDIARMTVSDIYNFKTNQVKFKITVDEHKTGKTARDLPLDSRTRQRLLDYLYTLPETYPDSLLFPSQKRNPDGTQRHLNTESLDKIYQKYTSQCFDPEEEEQTHISTYAARKTYGYNIYTECIKKHNGLIPGTDINALQYVQSVYNHNSSMTTLRYIGAYDTPATQLAEDIAGQYDF